MRRSIARRDHAAGVALQLKAAAPLELAADRQEPARNALAVRRRVPQVLDRRGVTAASVTARAGFPSRSGADTERSAALRWLSTSKSMVLPVPWPAPAGLQVPSRPYYPPIRAAAARKSSASWTMPYRSAFRSSWRPSARRCGTGARDAARKLGQAARKTQDAVAALAAARAVATCRYSTDPLRPWVGVGPLQHAAATGAASPGTGPRTSSSTSTRPRPGITSPGRFRRFRAETEWGGERSPRNGILKGRKGNRLMDTTRPDAAGRESAAESGGSLRFALTIGAWFVGLFGLMRLGWVEHTLLTPFAQLQQRVAEQLTGGDVGPALRRRELQRGRPHGPVHGRHLRIPRRVGGRGCAAPRWG